MSLSTHIKEHSILAGQGGLLTTAQAAAVAAQAWPQRSPIESWNMVGGGVSTAGSGQNGWTWQNVVAARNLPYAIRVSIGNVGTGTFTVDKQTLTPSTTYVANGDPTGGVAAVNVTFSGSASITTTAAASAQETTWATSDWMLFQPLARTDVTNAPALVHHRLYTAASTGLAYQSTLASLPYSGNANTGLVRIGNAMTGDKIATPTGFLGTLTQGIMVLCAYEFRGVSRCLRLGVIGDSIAAGTESGSTAQYLNSYAEGACNIVNNNLAASASISQQFWSSMDFGWPSQTYTQITQRMASILSAFALDAMVIPVWSPNSSPSDAPTTATNIGQTLDMIARCIAARVVPILATMPPRNSYGTTNDNPRKTINATFKQVAALHGYPLVDFDAILSDQGTPAQYIVGLTTDGLHPNAAGKALMQSALAAVLPSSIPL